MILIDTALAKRESEGRPVRVAMIGAGFMARGIALQILKYSRGIRLVAISNRNLDAACKAYEQAGVQDARTVQTQGQLEDNIRKGLFSVTDSAMLLCRAEGVDVVLEATGAVEFGAQVALEAIRHRKHILLMNAELDGTVGPILKVHADKASVVYTNVDGDQPGVELNLYRFVRGIGVKPVLCGNLKGLHDPYRNPTTQRSFAEKWKQKPHMVASFADGTKISFEQAIVANATGMRVHRRGMIGPTVPVQGMPLSEAVKLLPLDEILHGPGIVDYIVGAEPGPGVFVLGTHDDPVQQHYLNLYKLGPGPLYLFYTPYHLCHFEVPNTIARAAIFGDATIAPAGAPIVDVVATAKRDLTAGETIDDIGYYMTFGQCENSDVVSRDRLLPMGLAAGCTLRRDVPKDAVLTYADVLLPKGRLCDRLREEQDLYFSKTPALLEEIIV
jgi:predicted homoserine dehydrogenase-like protein